MQQTYQNTVPSKQHSKGHKVRGGRISSPELRETITQSQEFVGLEENVKPFGSEGGREALYQQQILSGGVNDQIKTQYRQVAGKYQDVLTLEASVAELHQMFLDFALLTEQQGELLDQIEYQVRSAADYVEDANVDVYEAIEYQKKIRKKQCWIMLIVVILIIIVLFSTGILP